MNTDRVRAEVDRICATVPIATVDQVKAVIDKAIAAEREACAVIAIDHAEFCRKEFYNGGHESLDERASGAAWIAELIRKRQ